MQTETLYEMVARVLADHDRKKMIAERFAADTRWLQRHCGSDASKYPWGKQ